MANAFISYKVEDRSYVAFIKREIHNKVVAAGFSRLRVGEIDIIVSEITSNLVKHASGGELLYRLEDAGTPEATFETISIDSGPGITDINRVMRDGVSTSNTLGHGLGAIGRLSNFSQIYSLPRWGTVLYSVVNMVPRAHDGQNEAKTSGSQLNVDIKALCVIKQREVVCGDGYRLKTIRTGKLIFFADGLGHGDGAHEAVEIAGQLFMKSSATDPIELIRTLHESIRKTRGLVGTVAHIDVATKELTICGVGNIHTRLFSGIESRNFMSYNGTIGLVIPTTLSLSRSVLEKNQHLIMSSDGIQSRWDLSRYPSIFRYDSMILAAVIYKDFTRRSDDASVLVAKIA